MAKSFARLLADAIAAGVLAASPATATSITYAVSMTGAQEVPGPGDPDGTAVGTITIDDSSGLISWSLTYANLDTLTAMHIHGPGGPVGVAAGVFVGLGVATTGGAGTLINSVVTSAANALAINATGQDQSETEGRVRDTIRRRASYRTRIP